MELKNQKILLTGGAGFLGSHIKEELEKRKVKCVTIPRSVSCDLRLLENCLKVTRRVDLAIHAAGNVGGIGYNQQYPGTLFYDNAMMGINLIEAARINKVKKVVVIGTICAYPKFTPVPFEEKNLWNGYPEETNAPYGLAKKILLVQSQAYRTQYGLNAIYLLPVNLYGPGDNFSEKSSHVIPALIKKFVEAKKNKSSKVTIWGTGKASREFLYVADAARAVIMASEKYNKPGPVNIGSGMEITIKELAETIKDIAGYKGKIIWDQSKPDGQPRRKLDVNRAKDEFGFTASTDFHFGLKKTVDWYSNL